VAVNVALGEVGAELELLRIDQRAPSRSQGVIPRGGLVSIRWQGLHRRCLSTPASTHAGLTRRMNTTWLFASPTKDMFCEPTPPGVPGAGQRASSSSSTTAARSTISLFQPIRLRPIRPGRKLSGPRFNSARRFSIRGRPRDRRPAMRTACIQPLRLIPMIRTGRPALSVRCRHCLTLALGRARIRESRAPQVLRRSHPAESQSRRPPLRPAARQVDEPLDELTSAGDTRPSPSRSTMEGFLTTKSVPSGPTRRMTISRGTSL
jgi:hypothetical protein